MLSEAAKNEKCTHGVGAAVKTIQSRAVQSSRTRPGAGCCHGEQDSQPVRKTVTETGLLLSVAAKVPPAIAVKLVLAKGLSIFHFLRSCLPL